jgi:hypothetical protein
VDVAALEVSADTRRFMVAGPQRPGTHVCAVPEKPAQAWLCLLKARALWRSPATITHRACCARALLSRLLPPPLDAKACVDSRTRAVVVNNPSNPCGSLFSDDNLRALLAVPPHT